MTTYLIVYLVIAAFGAAFAATDNHRAGVIVNGLLGLAWPLLVLAVLFTFLVRR